ncbi:MAG: response regulator [Bacteroidia bacterium]
MKKIAIVDDDHIFQFTTKVKIEKLQLADEIKIFNDGEEVFEFLKNSSEDDWPNYLLLDINMPIVDGWDFLKLYDQLSSELKDFISIYMLSSSINPVDLEKADKHPYIRKYVTKPLHDEVLKVILK